ncbi:MAG: DUF2478 domain-containing protein [Rhodobacteraceae bacterium]|nr:DUF2478 domain-containing protein [Paracoccaceae bacterium]
MKIALVSSTERGETDRLLREVAERLQRGGAALCGIVKVAQHVSAFDNGCDMMVRVLPDGPVIEITQSLGKGSDACRLDPGAIADAVSKVESGALQGADLFILNKFGPEEAAGRGFCSVIGQAVEHGIPVLVGVGGASREAFDTFAAGLAETLPPETDVICEWCHAAMAKDPVA